MRLSDLIPRISSDGTLGGPRASFGARRSLGDMFNGLRASARMVVDMQPPQIVGNAEPTQHFVPPSPPSNPAPATSLQHFTEQHAAAARPPQR